MNPASHKTVVLVDDEKAYVDLMSHMLGEHLGWRIVGFTRPLDALGALPTLRPAVVVTDYFMPQVNGLQFIQLAAPLTPESSFVMITGHNLSSIEDDIARLKPLRSVLAKPFGWRQLADEILRVWPTEVQAPAVRAMATE